MTKKLCNVEYKHDGQIVVCRQEGPRVATRRATVGGLLVCAECWPAIMEHFTGKYAGKNHYFVEKALAKKFLRVP